MPKVTIVFNLPEERDEYELQMKASNLHGALWDMYQFLRSDSKHGEGKYAEFYEKEFFRILKDNEVEI